ncbi:MAG: tyrosine--tRNA ligase [Bacteroidia bacterium]|nr:tyrosine--tRNA ligase [Bacteroidia bacterium]
MNFVEELTWRGMIHDMMPGLEEQLKREVTSAYVGIDPTADSLHIGHLVGVMMLKHFQLAGHKPIERNLLDESTLRHNQECLKVQIAKFLDFDTKEAKVAEMVNNYDWMKDFSFLDFIRDIGKHITVNYMMAKDSVKKRLDPDSGEAGMSFTEFTYQLVQGTDFLHLYETKNCKLQMGGSDQWGNITTGTELIRRKAGGEAFALTCPLIKKADGAKFGKTESGNVWLDPVRTSPYKFYQFWLNTSDADAEKYIKIFTVLSKETINQLIEEHQLAPHLRQLQKVLAKEVTCMVHSEADHNLAVEASEILFGKGTEETLRKLDEATFLSVFEGVPQFEIAKSELETGINIIDLLTEKTTVFPSKGEARRTIAGGGVAVNKVKVEGPDEIVTPSKLIGGKYLLVQKGKKNYFLLIAG